MINALVLISLITALDLAKPVWNDQDYLGFNSITNAVHIDSTTAQAQIIDATEVLRAMNGLITKAIIQAASAQTLTVTETLIVEALKAGTIEFASGLSGSGAGAHFKYMILDDDLYVHGNFAADDTSNLWYALVNRAVIDQATLLTRIYSPWFAGGNFSGNALGMTGTVAAANGLAGPIDNASLPAVINVSNAVVSPSANIEDATAIPLLTVNNKTNSNDNPIIKLQGFSRPAGITTAASCFIPIYGTNNNGIQEEYARLGFKFSTLSGSSKTSVFYLFVYGDGVYKCPFFTTGSYAYSNANYNLLAGGSFQGSYPYFFYNTGQSYSFASAPYLQITNSSNGTMIPVGIFNTKGTLPTNYSGATLILNSTFTEASSGTHPLVCQLALREVTEKNGGGSTSETANLFIEGPYNNAGTGNSYSIYSKSGINRFDGPVLCATSTTVHSTYALVVNGGLIYNYASVISARNEKEQIQDATQGLFAKREPLKIHIFDWKKPSKPEMPKADLTDRITIGKDGIGVEIKDDNGDYLTPESGIEKIQAGKVVSWVSKEIVIKTKEQVYAENLREYEQELQNGKYQQKEIGLIADEVPDWLKHDKDSWSPVRLILDHENRIQQLETENELLKARLKAIEEKLGIK